MHTEELLQQLHQGNRRALARVISIVENDTEGALQILQQLNLLSTTPVIGITGPPGAGKSTLVSTLTSYLVKQQPNCKIAILAVDPTSPFTNGSLLGDRLRMGEHFNNPNVFIRSLATRGALGGLSAKTIEITDVLKAAGFDYIIIETVGVGQSEVEIAALADTTVVVFVPESGDEIQTIKSGIMEIADIFVVNKCDREGADKLVMSLKSTLHDRKVSAWNVPVVKTIASTADGIADLARYLNEHHQQLASNPHHTELLFNKATRLAQTFLLKKNNLPLFREQLLKASQQPAFNMYQFIASYFS